MKKLLALFLPLFFVCACGSQSEEQASGAREQNAGQNQESITSQTAEPDALLGAILDALRANDKDLLAKYQHLAFNSPVALMCWATDFMEEQGSKIIIPVYMKAKSPIMDGVYEFYLRLDREEYQTIPSSKVKTSWGTLKLKLHPSLYNGKIIFDVIGNASFNVDEPLFNLDESLWGPVLKNAVFNVVLHMTDYQVRNKHYAGSLADLEKHGFKQNCALNYTLDSTKTSFLLKVESKDAQYFMVFDSSSNAPMQKGPDGKELQIK